MKIQKNFLNFVNEKKSQGTLSYYLFDWDNNILNMSTVIHLEHLVDGEWKMEDVSTEKFAEVRHYINDYYNGKQSEWRYYKDNANMTYSDFRDFGPKGDRIFLNDTKEAIRNNNFGPVWYDFIGCLVKGSLFAIITARGHEPETIKNCVKWIIYNCLTNDQFNLMINNLKKFSKLFDEDIEDITNDELISNYLELCDFIGISSSWFVNKFNTIGAGQSASPESHKLIAARYFINKINKYGEMLGYNIKIGFSDDDLSTSKAVYNFFKHKLSLDFPLIDYHTYHTFQDGKYKM